MKRTVFCFILLLFVLSGCIEPYKGKTDSIDSILVVEGIITSGTTRVLLSKSVGLDESAYGDLLNVNNAQVFIECEDGTTSPVAYSTGSGNYLVQTGQLDTNAKYRLVIRADGEEYQSGYLAPAVSPPVIVDFAHDEVNVHVCVTTDGDDRQPGYYLWSYKEDWEVYAVTYGDWVVIDGVMTPNDLGSPNNRYYCWRKDSSQVLILGTTEKLVENSIHKKKINSFYRTDSRTSVLYRVRVKQNTIHKEGYDFFYNLQKNIEQTGSIFGPIPSEIMGNIRCVSNPDIPVIGYVDVSTTSTDEQYLTSIFYDPADRAGQSRMCAADTLMNPSPPPEIGSGYVFYYESLEGKVYIPERCVDCTKNGGSKNKPENWPNDHL